MVHFSIIRFQDVCKNKCKETPYPCRLRIVIPIIHNLLYLLTLTVSEVKCQYLFIFECVASGTQDYIEKVNKIPEHHL